MSMLGKFSSLAALYGLSIGVLFLAELLLGRSIPSAEFGQYQLFRNVLPLIAMLSLLGADQALTRLVAEHQRRQGFRTLWLQCAGLSIGIGAVSAGLLASEGATQGASLLLVAVAGCFLVTSELSAAYQRGAGSYVSSSLTQQAYRLLTGIFLLVLTLTGNATGSRGIIALASAALLGAAFGFFKTRQPMLSASPVPQSFRRLGYAFSLSLLSFTAIDWLDQFLLLLRYDSLALTGDYAVLKLLTVYPLLSLGSIIGFIAMPEVVRRRERIKLQTLQRFALALLVGLLLAAVAMAFVLYHIADLIVGRQPTVAASVLLAATGAARVFYVLPSAVLGAIGSPREILKSSVVSLLSLVVLIVAMLFLPIVDGVTLASLALFTATVVRVGIAYWFADAVVRGSGVSVAH